MSNEISKERTFVIIKPDGVQRSLMGEIIKRFERVGLKLVGLKFEVPEAEKIEQHYTLDPQWKQNVGEKAIEAYKKKGQEAPESDPIKVGDIVIEGLKKYMTSGPVVMMVWQGAHSVELVRKLVGGTEPRTSDVGTIRGDFVLDSYMIADNDGRAVRNLIHASGSVEEAKQEIAHWFGDKGLVNYKLVQEGILYDVNLDGILE
jgi:nucleoside-diphosphate kinase